MLSLLLVLLCGLALWGCSNNNRVEINHKDAYFVQMQVPFAFSPTVYGYNDDSELELVDVYKMADTNPLSYLQFDEDFTRMWIIFVDTIQEGQLELVITSGAPKNGNIRGAAARIMPDGPDVGKLVRYSFWSDKNIIYMRTLVTYRIGTEYDSAHSIRTVERDTVVAEFLRTPPGYFVGGGG